MSSGLMSHAGGMRGFVCMCGISKRDCMQHQGVKSMYSIVHTTWGWDIPQELRLFSGISKHVECRYGLLLSVTEQRSLMQSFDIQDIIEWKMRFQIKSVNWSWNIEKLRLLKLLPLSGFIPANMTGSF